MSEKISLDSSEIIYRLESGIAHLIIYNIY